VDAGLVATPYMISFAFLAIVLAMSFELVDDAVRAARFAEDIRISEERWRTFMENINLAVVGVDAEGRINYANPFFQKLSSYDSDDLIGIPAASVVGQSETAPLSQSFEQTAADAPPPRRHGTVVGATGEQHSLIWSTVRLRARDGSYAGLLSIGEDVTERLKAQRELRRTQREMEHLTRAGMLGDLASALAHELNQPLAAILSNAQAARRFLVSDAADLDELREILDDIVRDDKRAGEVIRSMRAMLRKGEVRREAFSIAEVVGEVVGLLEGEFVAHAITVRTEPASYPSHVEAGRIEIQQVIMNLAMNAMRAMADTPTPRREVVIATATEGRHIRVSVADHGPGITPAQLPHIFEPFFTTRSSGLGMGLAICRRIVEAHGGRIWAENVESGGARFSFTLPAAKDAQAPARRPHTQPWMSRTA
jgi:PAS domain S-box-containing protein